MPINVSYLTYANTANENSYPGTWIAEMVPDANPAPGSPWVTVTSTEFDTLLAAQQSEFAALRNTELVAQDRQRNVHAAWETAGAFVAKYYDTAGLVRCLNWLTNTATPPAAKTMIEDVRRWVDTVMEHYLIDIKPYLQAGVVVPVEFDSIGPAPWTFTQIYLAAETPVISTNPADATVVAGQTATFVVTLSFGHDITYLWQRSAPGSTEWVSLAAPSPSANSYTTPVLAIEDSGARYRCVLLVRGRALTATWPYATLTVTGI